MSMRRAGFSLIEALVVLAIGGMALAIIFTIGTKAGDTGFSLGRRAMSVADSDIAISDLRSILRSAVVRPDRAFVEDVDRPTTGSASRLETDVVFERANQCGPRGWAGRLVLTIQTGAGQNQLVCEAAGRTTVLVDLKAATGAFSYSTDGRTWTPDYVSGPVRSEDFEVIRSKTLWVRFISPTTGDVIESSGSGAPQYWLRAADG